MMQITLPKWSPAMETQEPQKDRNQEESTIELYGPEFGRIAL